MGEVATGGRPHWSWSFPRGTTKACHLEVSLRAALVALVVALVVVLVVVFPVIGAPFGPVDDHEILDISAGRLSFLQAAVEIGRFRPAYWIFRFGETAVWGTNPTGWLLDRAVLAGLTIVVGYLLARRFTPPTTALLAAALIVLGPQAEAWYRFGPQEAYAVPLLLGSIVATVSGRYRLGLALGVVTALTKEPFVPVALLVVAFAWWRGARWPALAAAVPVLAAGAIVAWLAVTSPTLPTFNAGQGRYLLPLILVPIAGFVWLGARRPRLAVGIGSAWLALGAVVTLAGGLAWSAMDRAWATEIAALPTARPFVIHATVADYERVFAYRSFLSGELMVDVGPGSGYLWQRLRDLEVVGGSGFTPLATSPN